MADEFELDSILDKLKQRAKLSPEELAGLQSHVDGLEMAAGTPNHDTHTSPGGHFTHHHPQIEIQGGILEQIETKTELPEV
ncbi:hypothetical protein [Nocardia arizonensis]|uniref:hypothetical protein n=1 Tax=Nocardia arizonensis TaxID=1141647 RepID=UPI0006CFB6AE|nr:hypothetical protein [Nocardia arizonensis]